MLRTRHTKLVRSKCIVIIMGNKGSVPVVSGQPVVAAAPVQPAAQVQTLKDTTLRSIVFNQKDLEVVPNSEGQMILKTQISKEQFDLWVHTLKVMAQLVRTVYCDSGIIREVLLSDKFGRDDNKSVNALITDLDKKYSKDKTSPSSYVGSKEGKPMVSYVITESPGVDKKIATYVSSPSDLTFLVVPGEQLAGKLTSVLPTDLIISFKGSSTIKNFKHDLYSQFTPVDLATVMPPGTTMSSTTTKNFVTGSFVTPMLKSWDILKKEIEDANPTRLFITGHSLGGAYASLLGFILAECGRVTFPSIQSIHIVTFGCPTILGDGARNTFNAHLDSGYVTLDRVTSYGITGNIADVIPGIPVGFSHPGFQPLRTEFYPEKKTGRAYNLETVRKVYQTGGVLGFGPEKNKYEVATKTHMPNRITIPARNPLVQAFAHAEYFDMTWLNAFRIYGMKNPGFKGKDGQFYTFRAEIFPDGIKFSYSNGVPEEAAEEAVSKTQELPGAPKGGGRTRRSRRIRK